MKKIISITICILCVLHCLAQDAIKVNVSYNQTNQYLVVDIENVSHDTSFLIYNQNPSSSQLDGSCLYVSKSYRQDYGISDMYKEQFPLVEYDKATNLSEGKCPRYIDLTPLKKVCYGLSLKDKKQYNNLNRLYVKVKLVVTSVRKGTKRKIVHNIKVYQQCVDIKLHSYKMPFISEFCHKNHVFL
ncbi:MAG: hypothetical protein LKI39_02990 [Bacteroides sp.]|jgi:hypothetical protein|nr:hypothetical protein [Bacteroides sp.]MCI1681503.1 hypothetical protein [Bacteroides sp.]